MEKWTDLREHLNYLREIRRRENLLLPQNQTLVATPTRGSSDSSTGPVNIQVTVKPGMPRRITTIESRSSPLYLEYRAEIDALYRNMNRPKKTPTSPLDNPYYATEEKPTEARKGCGAQKLKITNRKAEAIDRQPAFVNTLTDDASNTQEKKRFKSIQKSVDSLDSEKEKNIEKTNNQEQTRASGVIINNKKRKLNSSSVTSTPPAAKEAVNALQAQLISSNEKNLILETANDDVSTVLKGNGDYATDSSQLDQQKHEEMQEIVPKKKKTIAADPEPQNIVDKLQSNSNQEYVLEKPINNENSLSINNNIERLKGSLNVNYTQLPPLIPIHDLNTEAEDVTRIEVGPIEVTKTSRGVLYRCCMKSCSYTSTSQVDFGKHCKSLHANDSWTGVCAVCKQNVNSTEIVSAYNHLLDMHKNDLTVKVTELEDETYSYLMRIVEVPPLTLVNNAIGSGNVTYSTPATITSLQPTTSEYNLLPISSPVKMELKTLENNLKECSSNEANMKYSEPAVIKQEPSDDVLDENQKDFSRDELKTLENNLNQCSSNEADMKYSELAVIKQESYDDDVDENQKNISRDEQANKTEISLQEIENMNLDLLRSGDFNGTYGPFGKPAFKQYSCPLCSEFKTKKTDDFTWHLYKELRYYRYACVRCHLPGITYNSVYRHSLKQHTAALIRALPSNSQIEQWTEKVLAVQCRLMEHSDSSPKISSALSMPSTSGIVVNDASIKKGMNLCDTSNGLVSDGNLSRTKQSLNNQLYQCQYCDYTCKFTSDLKQHEKRHWVQKPLKCGYCNVEGVTKDELIQHCKSTHPNAEPIIMELPTLSVHTSANDEVEAETEEDPFGFKESDAAVVNKLVYLCNYCSKRCSKESEIKIHWQTSHKSKNVSFKYKRLTQPQLVTKDTINYKCCYCNFIGHSVAVTKHFIEKHPNMNISVFSYICGYCHDYFKTKESIQVHCKQSHANFDLHYTNIPDPPWDDSEETDKLDDNICDYCGAEYDTCNDLVDHYKLLHSHIELNPPPDSTPQKQIQQDDGQGGEELKEYMCPQCNHTSNNYNSMRDHLKAHAVPYQCHYCHLRFKYPSKVKIHQVKKHPNLEFKYQTIKDGNTHFDDLKRNLLKLTKDGTYEKVCNIKCVKRVKHHQGNQHKKIRIIKKGFGI